MTSLGVMCGQYVESLSRLYRLGLMLNIHHDAGLAPVRTAGHLIRNRCVRRSDSCHCATADGSKFKHKYICVVIIQHLLNV